MKYAKKTILSLSVILLCGCISNSGTCIDSGKELDEYAGSRYQVAAGDYDRIAFSEYELLNNVWGKNKLSKYDQFLYAEEDTGIFGWVWDWPGFGFNVKAYPEIIYGWKPWHKSSTSDELPAALEEKDFIIKYNYETIGCGAFNTAFVIYLCDAEKPTPDSVIVEIMIWLEHRGMVPAGLRTPSEVVFIRNDPLDLYIKKSFRVAGQTRDFFAFSYQDAKKNGEIRLSEVIRILLDRELIRDNLYISSIEFGNEVLRGSGKMKVLEYDISAE